MEFEGRFRSVIPPRELAFGALTGLVLAAVSSTGILAERLARAVRDEGSFDAR